MSTVPSQVPGRDGIATSVLAASAFAAGALAVGAHISAAVPVAILLLLAAGAARSPVLPWSRVLMVLLLVILFIPIRRYRLPGDLPFQLEPYRVFVGLIALGWLASLLVDRRVRLRKSRLELPVGLIVVATIGSMALNPTRVSEIQSTVLKTFTIFVSFLVVLYLVVSVVRTRPVLDLLVKTLVAGGAVVAIFAVLEARAGIAPFTQLHLVFPFLTPDPSFGGEIGRGGAVRAYGPAEHPIALGAALVMLVPLAIYVVRTAGARWWLATAALVVGVLSTVSRTGVVMLIVVALVFLWLRPRETRRFWPALVPILVITHFAVPGTLGSLKQSFLPEDGLVAQQRGSAGSCSSAGRVADLAPTLAEVAEKPFLGYGFGTRIVTGPESNACILDNQWLGNLVDVGAFGTLSWLLLFIIVIRRFGRAAKADHSAMGWLLVAVVAAIAAYGVGMFTFDAFGFTQVTLMLFILLGIGAAAAALVEANSPRGDHATAGS